MRFDCRFGFCSSHAFITLALLCAACSSDSSGTGGFPLWMAPDFTPPAAGAAGATSASAGSSPNPSVSDPAAANTPGASVSEAPIQPTLMPVAAGSAGENGAPSAGGTGENGAMAVGGAGMVVPDTGSDGEVSAARPSVRCGSAEATPSFDLPNTLFSVPAAYDGTTPLPVVIAFHAAGNPNTQLRGILGDALDDDYIVFYPKSDGNGWSNPADAPKVDAIFAALDGSACYDQSRVFATGHSSGAQFIVQRLCAGESRWRAVAPVASSVYCSAWEPIPSLVIHGIGDVEREAYGLDDGDGLKDIVPYRTSNGCQESFTEVAVEGCTSGGVQVNPGCRDFEGCGETTRWCQHDDPQYGTSHHGVPCFGARVIKAFFDSFR